MRSTETSLPSFCVNTHIPSSGELLHQDVPEQGAEGTGELHSHLRTTSLDQNYPDVPQNPSPSIFTRGGEAVKHCRGNAEPRSRVAASCPYCVNNEEILWFKRHLLSVIQPSVSLPFRPAPVAPVPSVTASPLRPHVEGRGGKPCSVTTGDHGMAPGTLCRVCN